VAAEALLDHAQRLADALDMRPLVERCRGLAPRSASPRNGRSH
jgi:hypothetical protein